MAFPVMRMDSTTWPFDALIGCGLLFTCTIVWYLLFIPDDVIIDRHRYKAFALALIPWLIEHLGSVLNKVYSHRGASDVPNMAVVVLCVVFIAGFLNQCWAPVVAKAAIATLFFYGVGFTFFTEFFLRNIRQMDVKRLEDPKHGPHIHFLVQLQSGVMTALLERGEDPIRTFGLSCIIFALGLLHPFEKMHAACHHSKLSVLHGLVATGFAVLTFLMLRGDGGPTDDESLKTTNTSSE